MTDQATQSLRDVREAVVLEHIAAENRHDVDAVIATFHQPSYEVNGERYDGEAAVRTMLGSLLSAFPDLHLERLAVRHTDDAVIGEGRLTGTHRGTFVGVAPTGRAVDYRIVGIFEFDGDRLVAERVSFDSATLFRQLGVFPGPTEANYDAG
ncbi:MAG TPA: ester cyclase [Acidimicrobiales bacterium]|nr:ester cyclase [Acidimicrobiales bacterium]